MEKMEIESKVESIIDANIEEIPWEGDYVDRWEMQEQLVEFIMSIKK